MSKKSKSTWLNEEHGAVQEALAKAETVKPSGSTVPPAQTDHGVIPNGGYWTGTGWSSGGTQAYVACVHKGDVVIFEHDGKQLFGGNGRGVDEFSGAWDLIIDLANQLDHPKPFGFVREQSSPKFDVLREHTYGDPEIMSEVLDLAWPDYGVPRCGLPFWEALWPLLGKKTVMMCVGGHGRTGSCLTALMISAGVDYYSALKHVRTVHCEKAIESLSQEQYLHDLWVEKIEQQLETNLKPSDRVTWMQSMHYAKTHKPTHKSSYGLEVHVKGLEGKKGLDKPVETTPLPKVGSKAWYEQDDEYCDNATCNVQYCKDSSHFFILPKPSQGVVDLDQMCDLATCLEPNCVDPTHHFKHRGGDGSLDEDMRLL